MRPEKEIAHLRDRLCNLRKRALLFLRNLRTVQWHDENSGQKGVYSCHRHPHDKIQEASEVELKSSINRDDQPSETFLVFRKEVQPPQTVINELLQGSEDDDERQRIQKSAKKLQPVEVAFKLHDGKITTINNSVLFSYFPTQKETHLKFFIQASYKTTLARDHIETANQWNEWLIQETAAFFPKILEQLKTNDLLEPAFFNVLPLKGDVENEFKPIAEALQKAMQERAFVPTQRGGYAKAETVFHVDSKGVAIPRGMKYRYAKSQNVYYPHAEILRQLMIENNWHFENNWLHPEIRDTEEFRQCFKVMREAGVKPIEVSRVLRWLEEKEPDWFKDQSNEWLRLLYNYLKEQKSHLERIKKLPLVRREDGNHVCASDELVFFPPNADERREEIKPFLNNLPILQSALLVGEEGNDIEAFLKSVEVKVLRRVDMILEGILPQYHESTEPSPEENRLHVRYLFKVWNDVSKSEQSRLKSRINAIPILRAYKNQNSVPEFRYIKPGDAYLPKVYTSDDDLQTYFSVYDGDIWFVDGAYLEDKSDAKTWLQFLKAIGSEDTLRVIKKSVPVNDEECSSRGVRRWRTTSTGAEVIEDRYLCGLSVVLDKIREHKRVDLSRALWYLLVKIAEREQRDTFFQGIYSSRYRSNTSPTPQSFLADFYRQLKETAWLPDEQGDFHLPSEYFAPTSENCRLLRDSVVYLHPDFDISQDNETAQWLAKKLGIHLSADTNSVLNYLRTLSGTKATVKDVELLYHFLNRQDARRSEEFKKNPLIFTPNPESRWWRVDEVFWEDKSEVLENDRRCLKAHYPAILRSFFINLGVSEQASQRDYACRIQEIATTEQATDKKVRESLRRLYKCLITWQKNEWEIIYDDRCWLGKEGQEWKFFTRQELVLKDHPHIGEIFEGKIPFWTFDGDLSSLASTLKIEGCSQAQVEFRLQGDQEEDTDLSEKVRNLCPYIYAFLKSSRLSEKPEKEKFAEVLEQVSVCRVNQLKVTYNLNGIPVPDPNPRLSFLDVTNQPKLWLGLEVNESEYPELIGDALQDYFGVNELGRFVEDLLTKKPDRVLSNWKRKGLDTDLCVPSQENDFIEDKEESPEPNAERLPNETVDGNVDLVADESDGEAPTGSEGDESIADEVEKSETQISSDEDNNSGADESEVIPIDSKALEISKVVNNLTSDGYETSTDSSDIGNINSSDMQVPTKTKSVTIQPLNGESEVKTPTVNESSDGTNGDEGSATEKSENRTYTPSRTGSANRSGGHSLSTSTSKKSGGGGHGGYGGGGEGEEHENLKKNLANNPSQFGEELKLVKIEYTFGSGDRVDILLKDGSDNPVTVEVETGFSSGPGRYVGVWQAVKYQHLAAMEYSLVCEQVRSILAAPEIPDDVKIKCEELGIEAFEVPQI